MKIYERFCGLSIVHKAIIVGLISGIAWLGCLPSAISQEFPTDRIYLRRMQETQIKKQAYDAKMRLNQAKGFNDGNSYLEYQDMMRRKQEVANQKEAEIERKATAKEAERRRLAQEARKRREEKFAKLSGGSTLGYVNKQEQGYQQFMKEHKKTSDKHTRLEEQIRSKQERAYAEQMQRFGKILEQNQNAASAQQESQQQHAIRMARERAKYNRATQN
ncbi:MAG: hypothetical protein HQM11_01390 [SAR324 cluster bacterium]|nr:hypothetical protein [SAR324 cluster bacterium]